MQAFPTTRRRPPLPPAAHSIRAVRAAFSLIEVNLAILVVATGLLALFGLFPAGLRMSVSAIADTRQSMFANDVLGSLRANASRLTAEQWQDAWRGGAQGFWNTLAAGTSVAGATVGPIAADTLGSQYIVATGRIDNYFSKPVAGSKLEPIPVRYQIRVQRRRNWGSLDRLNQHLDLFTWRLTLICTDQPLGSFDGNPQYHLELRYAHQP